RVSQDRRALLVEYQVLGAPAYPSHAARDALPADAGLRGASVAAGAHGTKDPARRTNACLADARGRFFSRISNGQRRAAQRMGGAGHVRYVVARIRLSANCR